MFSGFRFWLIRKLAGNSMVVINADVCGKLSARNYPLCGGYVYNSRLINMSEGLGTIRLLGEQDGQPNAGGGS